MGAGVAGERVGAEGAAPALGFAGAWAKAELTVSAAITQREAGVLAMRGSIGSKVVPYLSARRAPPALGDSFFVENVATARFPHSHSARMRISSAEKWEKLPADGVFLRTSRFRNYQNCNRRSATFPLLRTQARRCDSKPCVSRGLLKSLGAVVQKSPAPGRVKSVAPWPRMSVAHWGQSTLHTAVLSVALSTGGEHLLVDRFIHSFGE